MKNLLGALLKAQQEFPALVKDAANPAFRSRYATLGAVQEAAFPILAKHGLVVLQSVRTDLTDRGLVVYVGATLFHVESGEQVQQEVGMIPAKQDPQGVGSAITYGRRYLLMTMLGLVPDDDDGNAASAPGGARLPQSVRAPVTRNGGAVSAPAASNGPAAGNGKPAAGSLADVPEMAIDPFADQRPSWRGVAEAVDWAMDLGAFDDEAAARGEIKKILQSVYPGRESCKPHELPAVFDAWYAEVRRRIARRQKA
jgi:hypothetical protein